MGKTAEILKRHNVGADCKVGNLYIEAVGDLTVKVSDFSLCDDFDCGYFICDGDDNEFSATQNYTYASAEEAEKWLEKLIQSAYRYTAWHCAVEVCGKLLGLTDWCNYDANIHKDGRISASVYLTDYKEKSVLLQFSSESDDVFAFISADDYDATAKTFEDLIRIVLTNK